MSTLQPGTTVLVGGGSGLIGSHLAQHLEGLGVRVRHLVRRTAQSPDEVTWSPSQGVLPHAALEGVDAVVEGSLHAGLPLPVLPAAVRPDAKMAMAPRTAPDLPTEWLFHGTKC